LIFIVPPVSADPFPDAGPITSGNMARLRFGRAAAPKHAPLAVKRAIWGPISFTTNRIGTAVVTNHLMTAVTIVPAPFLMY